MKRILLSTFLLLLPFALTTASAQFLRLWRNGYAGEALVQYAPIIPLKDMGHPLSSVTYKSFAVTRLRSRVDLVWETTWECDNHGFEVQRKTGDGEWRKVAFVFSQAERGNSNALLIYEYTDVNTERAESQYRLRQIDNDQQASFSDTRSIKGY